MLRTLIDNLSYRFLEWWQSQTPLHFTLSEHRRALLWREGDHA